MEFNDLQVIWNSQHDQPMYGVNEEGLHNTLRSKSKRFRRLIFWQYFQTFCSCTFMMMAIAGLLLLNASGVLGRIGSSRALLGWEITALAFALVCWLQFGLSHLVVHRHQKKQEKRYTTSLRDDLDKEINRTRYQIKTRSHIMLGFIPPYVGTALWIIVVFGLFGILSWTLIPVVVVMVAALIIESRSQRRFVEREIAPRLLELETLLEKLTAPQHEATELVGK